MLISSSIGDPGRNRTSSQQLRRLLLYPLSYGAVGDALADGGAAVGRSAPLGAVAHNQLGGQHHMAGSATTQYLRGC